jgi:hypothetical protein
MISVKLIISFLCYKEIHIKAEIAFSARREEITKVIAPPFAPAV